MNTRTRRWVISENSKVVNHQFGSPQLLPEKHPLEDSCPLHLQRKVQKRRKLNDETFSKPYQALNLQQPQIHSQYELASKTSMVKYIMLPAQQLLQEPQFNIPRQFSPLGATKQQQTQTLAASDNDTKISGKTSRSLCDVSQPPPTTSSTSNVSTNAFNSDSSMVTTDHLDAPENDDQEFSILNIIPSLISEKNRKAAFVENLVDAAGLIIELIWANFSVSPCAKIITLRVFLQETLRRSRTSYSTLQTALFYLIRIKTKISLLSRRSELPLTPTSEYPPDLNQNQNQNNDPATCGRRMFLAALIVASKYLQDRNYSNRAWSKISGLPVNEINANEICFLKLIDYNLFISEEIFKRWSSLLLTHMQAISGSEISSPDAFRRIENQREIEKFRFTLTSIDPKTMDSKRIRLPITPAVSAPGSPREQQFDINSTFSKIQRLKLGQRIVNKESRSKNMSDLDRPNFRSHEHDSQLISMLPSQASLVSPQSTPLQYPLSRSHLLQTITPFSLRMQSASQCNIDLREQPKKENSVSLPQTSTSSTYIKNLLFSDNKDIGCGLSPPSAGRLLNLDNIPDPKNSTEFINNVPLQNNCSEITFENCQERILLRSSA